MRGWGWGRGVRDKNFSLFAQFVFWSRAFRPVVLGTMFCKAASGIYAHVFKTNTVKNYVFIVNYLKYNDTMRINFHRDFLKVPQLIKVCPVWCVKSKSIESNLSGWLTMRLVYRSANEVLGILCNIDNIEQMAYCVDTSC